MKKFVLAAVLLAPIGFAHAQDREVSPWAITVTPTMNPLPVGLCAAVHLNVVDPATREPPRNPSGLRVTLADFDLSVESRGGAVVGMRLDDAHWSVCGCPGAPIGAEATITATYPARSSNVEARVANVRSQTTARLTTAAPKGNVSAPGCNVLPALAATAMVASPFATIAVTPVVTPPVTPPVTPDPFAPAPIAHPGREAIVGRPEPRSLPYEPGPVAVALNLSATGLWYEPGPITVPLTLAAQGSWFEPGPITASFTLSANGTWIEPSSLPMPIKTPLMTRP